MEQNFLAQLVSKETRETNWELTSSSDRKWRHFRDGTCQLLNIFDNALPQFEQELKAAEGKGTRVKHAKCNYLHWNFSVILELNSFINSKRSRQFYDCQNGPGPLVLREDEYGWVMWEGSTPLTLFIQK